MHNHCDYIAVITRSFFGREEDSVEEEQARLTSERNMSLFMLIVCESGRQDLSAW
jgi:hypothetical protein